MRRLLFLFLFLILVPQLEAALNVAITSPVNGSCYAKGATVSVNVVYTCNQLGYSLLFKIDGEGIDSIGVDSKLGQQSHTFTWNASLSGVYGFTVLLFKSGCDSASDSVNVTVVSIESLSGPNSAPLNKNASPPPEYITGNLTYTATTNPSNTPCEAITWSVGGGGQTVSPSSANGILSYTTKFQTVGTKTITVTCGNSSKQFTTYVYGIIEADLKDEPPAGATYASGIDDTQIWVRLNDNTISPTLTSIDNGYRLSYTPAPNELNIPGTNTVKVSIKDKAGNQNSPNPATWSFTIGSP